MQTRIEKIGNEFGLILPKELLDACGFQSVATVEMQDKSLVISPGKRSVREGWEEALDKLSDRDLDQDFKDLQELRELPQEWDSEEWHWPEKSDEQI